MTHPADPRVPRITTDEAQKLVRDHYAVDGAVTQLPSYLDANYLVESPDGTRYVLKIANTQLTEARLDFQNQGMKRLTDAGIPGAQLVPLSSGAPMTQIQAADGKTHWMRLVTWLPGTFLGDREVVTPDLMRDLGRTFAKVGAAFDGFTHEAMERALIWDLNQAWRVQPWLDDIDDMDDHDLLSSIFDGYFGEVQDLLEELPKAVIHNDGNDFNILTDGDRVTGLIDFGDMIYTARVNELAILCTYTALNKREPLAVIAEVVTGYQQERPLEEAEIDLLMELVLLRLTVSVLSSAHQKKKEPDNSYLSISEKPAWDLLRKLEPIHPVVARAVVRVAAGFPGHPNTEAVVAALQANRHKMAPLTPHGTRDHMGKALIFNFGPHGRDGRQFSKDADSAAFTKEVFDNMNAAGTKLGLGRWNENRALYTSKHFQGDKDAPARTVHIGVDLFLEPGEPIHAPLDGVVHSFALNDNPLDYGPTIVLEHRLDDVVCYTLYGHLDPRSLEGLHVGKSFKAGEIVCWIGDRPINGDWPPHLHFQIMVDMLDKRGDFPGVVTLATRDAWLDLCPDPNLFLGHPLLSDAAAGRTKRTLSQQRKAHLGRMLSVSYSHPIKMVRGQGQYLYDESGRQFLDMVNNVCHVGHCHPRVVAAAEQQNRMLNTNTRYLHDNIVDYAEHLQATFPEPLSVVFLVNSGSEANDLALRLAQAHTGRKDVIVLDVAYHGHVSSLIDLSPYKFNSKGGEGKPDHVHVAPMPDPYRGIYKRDHGDLGRRYGEHVAHLVEAANARGGPAAFFAESILGCGGQVILPDGYLKHAYEAVRAAGGVCVADEVQVGFGRVGSHMWAFETQNVIPDIVTLGKPIGNGHPLAAVVTTPEIAESFNNGMEYFNTFGGNPVSAAVGKAVLDVIQDEGLQENAAQVGAYLLTGLKELQERYPIIGDVRGMGLFIGVELVTNPQSLEPAPSHARYIVNRVKEEDILLSIDGPLHNVLKIKPPICFNQHNANTFLKTLSRILKEPAAQPTRH